MIQEKKNARGIKKAKGEVSADRGGSLRTGDPGTHDKREGKGGGDGSALIGDGGEPT